ncbi:hypothetical protein OUZ56_029051 [Daphnia magna]|uniref:Uncharacterized protein n=1 Tax=Daphnia magna TaxID=35525 RepID=A0ABR0B665_9CRUS|nr:hypothetical protein OUZ56_029051 [Daphnia magna]
MLNNLLDDRRKDRTALIICDHQSATMKNSKAKSFTPSHLLEEEAPGSGLNAQLMPTSIILDISPHSDFHLNGFIFRNKHIN